MKRILMITTGIATIWASGAYAQTAPTGAAPAFSFDPAGSTTEAAPNGKATTNKTEQITVSGVRVDNGAAIETKRQSTNIIDVIGGDEVRALPDNTVIEALRHIPGLSILPVNDTEHPQDEQITPVIRGLGPGYNNVTVDGLPIASPGTPDGSLGSVARGTRLDILPSSMISQLQVVKTFTPDLDPNAVGGAVNIVTHSAFDNGGVPFFTFDGALGHATDVGKPVSQPDPGDRLSATGSMTFGPDHRYGATLSANYQKISSFTEEHANIDSVYYNFYNNAGQEQTGANLGNGIPVPQQDRYWYAEDTRTHEGITGKFEARLSNNLDAYVSAGYYEFKTNYQRNEVDLGGNAEPTIQNQTPTTGSLPLGYVQLGYINDNYTQDTGLVESGVKWRPDDRQVISVRGSFSSASFNENYAAFKYGTGVSEAKPGSAGAPEVGTSNFAYTYDTSNFDYRFNIPPSQYYNLSNYQLLYYRPYVHREAADQIASARVDYDFNNSNDDRGFGFGAGVSYTDDRPRYSITRVDLEPNSNAGPITLAGAAGPTGAPFQYSKGLSLLTINPAAVLAQINALPSSDFNQTNQYAFNNQDNFTHVEQTVGSYALAAFRSDTVELQAGVHLDDTHQNTIGRLLLANGQFVADQTSSSYFYPLPSAIGTWHVTPSVDIRGGISQTIGRPSYDSYAARSSVVFGTAADVGNASATDVTVTFGNPGLKPRLSTNYDVGTDWLLSPQFGGIVSLAAFYKDIQDEIFTSNTLGYTYQGVNYVNALVSKPTNSSGANIKGLEFNAVLSSLGGVDPLLSGFGVSGNASVMAGELTVPVSPGVNRTIGGLVGQPNATANANLFYRLDGLELRAAYNYQGRSLRTVVNTLAFQDLYWAPRDQVDLSATYTFADGLSLYAQAENVTQSRIVSVTGPSKNLLRGDYTIPTTLWFGVRYTL